MYQYTITSLSAISGDKADTLWVNVEKLEKTCKVKTGEQWCKIMCDSVASPATERQTSRRSFATPPHRLLETALDGAHGSSLLVIAVRK